jgi:hypothetical protein
MGLRRHIGHETSVLSASGRATQPARPPEGIQVGVRAFDIRGSNAAPFDPFSADRAESRKVILTVFHERQVCYERNIYGETSLPVLRAEAASAVWPRERPPGSSPGR